jgi:hypothetical protein
MCSLIFILQLKNISKTEIITVELQAGSILGRTGTPVSSVAPVIFLYGTLFHIFSHQNSSGIPSWALVFG